jgi:diketogulonate reductase-like aldo/keto reductase
MTRAQVLLAWCIFDPQVITIPQTNNVDRIEENVLAAGGRLSEDQYSALCDTP